MTENDLKKFKSTGLACYRGSFSSIMVEGPDAWDFLNRITTRKFSDANVNESFSGALLSGKSEVHNLFQCWNRGPGLAELFPLVGSYETLLQELDKVHFTEKLELKVHDQLSWIELRSDKIPFAITNKVVEENIGDKRILIVPIDNWGIPGALMGASEAEDILSVVRAQALRILDFEEFHAVQEYYGFPAQSDFVTRFQILEMGLDRYIDRGKGCYPGQEVVEKIYTYGKPAKKLVRLTLKASEDEIKRISSDKAIGLFVDNDLVGSMGQIHCLEEGEIFGLGVVQRAVAEKGLGVRLGERGPVGKIHSLT